MLKSVLDYLENSEQRFPDKLAVLDANGSDTYADLADKARRVGTFLLKKGLCPNDVVVVLLGKERKALAAFWGVTYAGGIYSPIDSHTPTNRARIILDVLKPTFVLTDEENKEEAHKLIAQERVLFVEQAFMEEPDRTALCDVQKCRIDMDPLYIICTSGSTGVPKGVVISHRSVIDFTEESSEVMGFSSRERFANQAPFYFDASVPDLYCTIRNAASLYIIPEGLFTNPNDVLQYLKENEINAIFWVPSALVVIANSHILENENIISLKKIMFCGEVMPVKQYNIWKKYVPNAVYVNYYGPSETTYASTYYIINREFTNEESLPIGRAAINTDVIILDDANCRCLQGQIGELCIRGTGVALGYYNNWEKTQEVFVQNPLSPFYKDIIYRTGDLVRENDKGEIEYVGRKDFQIKVSGYRIELGEIETAVSAVPDIDSNCCLFDAEDQQIICVFVGNTDKKQIRSKIKETLPRYMIPHRYIKLDEMPMNSNGKIDRVALKNKYTNVK